MGYLFTELYPVQWYAFICYTSQDAILPLCNESLIQYFLARDPAHMSPDRVCGEGARNQAAKLSADDDEKYKKISEAIF